MTSRQEDFRGYILGINQMQEVVSIAVYRTGGLAIKLIGPHGYAHEVGPSNVHSLEGWQLEAAHIWKLDDVVYFPPSIGDSEKRLVALKERVEAEKRKAKPLSGWASKRE
jgi:hypothetical protein